MKYATFSILLAATLLPQPSTNRFATADEVKTTSTSTDRDTQTDESASMTVAVEDAIVKQTNDFRKSNDLDAVDPNKELMKTAKKFAEFMAETGKYGHHANGMTPAERAKKAGYDYCVVRENIAYRTNTGDVTADSLIEVFVQGWIDSPPHRENMLADYVTETGVAVATTDDVTYYAVQLFGRPKSSAFHLEITNESGEPQTVVFEGSDQTDEIEVQPRTSLKMTRCLPTTIALADSDDRTKISADAAMTITEDGEMKSQSR